jgi:hypothetical protein
LLPTENPSALTAKFDPADCIGNSWLAAMECRVGIGSDAVYARLLNMKFFVKY